MTNLTTTLEKSKELRLAGWSKKTLFSYVRAMYDSSFHLSMFNSQNDFNENDLVYNGVGISAFNDVEIEDAEEIYPAPTITELLEELDNNNILQYENDVMVGLPVGDFIDLFRSPDKLAECWLWAKQQNLLGRDKERMK